MVKFSFFCVEQVYHGKNPCGLRFLGRDKERKKIDITVEGPRPYFYILTSEKERIGTFPCILEDGFKSMYGDELTRVSLSNPWDIKDLVKNFSKTFEADVPYPTRVLIDKDIYTGIEVTEDGDIKHCDIDCEPRIMNLDVETDYQGGSNKDMMRPLIAISFYDNYTDTIYSLSYKEVQETYQKRYSYKSEVLKNSDGTFKDVNVVEIAVEGEVELLNLFKAYVKNFDVDVFTGWNINFDMIYILRRMETLNLDPDSLSPVGKYTWDTGDANGSNRGPRKQYVDNSGNFRDVRQKTRKFGGDSKKAMIRGRTIIDILKGYRRMKWKGVEGFKLDSVAKKEFGVGKIEYKGWMSDFWKNDFNNFIKYNIRDVEMCLAIDRKYSVIDSLLNIRKISGCEMSDILQNSRIFDVYILRYCLGKFVLPTKKYSSEAAQKIEGGFVLEPKVGLHKYVAALDLKGLYPSIMLSFNMSPETVDTHGDIIVGNGVRFKKETGILKDILVDLIKKRDELRAMLKTPEVFNDKDKYTNIYKRQYYYKTFSNCFSDDTNILTINGIKNIKDIKVGEFVYSINPKTKFVEIKPVIKTYKYKFNEQMYEFKSFKNYHFKVTSRHKMIVQNKWTGEILEMTASELYGVAQKTNKYRLLNHLPLQKKDHYELVDLSKYINKEEFIITDTEIVRKPLRENCPFTLHENRYVNKHDFLKFFGWFISEGHFHKVNKNSGFFSITQEQVKNHKELKTMFVSLFNKYKLRSDKRHFRIHSNVFQNIIENYVGNSSYTKQIPGFIFEDFGTNDYRIIWDALMKGDGSATMCQYSTKSKKLSEDFARLSLLIGKNPKIKISHSNTYRVRFFNKVKMYGCINKESCRKISYKGKFVYNLMVKDNHTVYAGIGGKFAWIKQSAYGITLYPGFRLFNPAIGSSITFVGRFLANKIRELCESKGYTVVRQDSVTGDRYTAVRINNIVTIKSFEELWNMTNRKITRDGKEIGYFDMSVECLSENIKTHKSEWQKINYVIKHKTNKKIYRLFNAYGETHVTEDHSCFNKDGVLQKSKDLNSFYRLSNIPKTDVLKKVKLSDYSDYLKYNDCIKIQDEYDVESNEFKALMKIIGAYIAEGSCSFSETSTKYQKIRVENTRGQIQIGNQNKDYLEIVRKSVNKLSNAVCNISGGDVLRYRPEKKTKYHRRAFKLRLSRSRWPKLLRDLCGYKSNGKKFPDFFFNLPKHIQDICLDMMYKGDGHVIRNDCQCYTTKSHALMSGLTYLWKQRDIYYHFRNDDRNNKNCHSIRQHKSDKVINHDFINKQKLTSYKEVYDLNVSDNHNFYDMLGGVLLHNTDSAFVITGKDTLEEAVKVGKELEDDVNNMFSTWFKGMNNDISYMSIKCEKIYGLMFSGAEKKLYAGKIDWDWEKGDISTKPDIEIKGFATVKSDRSMFSRTLQKKIFNMIFEGKNNDDIKKFILDEIDKFYKLEYDWEYIGIPKAITKDLDEYGTKNPWITGVKWSQENLTGFQFSPKPYLLYLCPNNKYNTTSICYNNENEVPNDLPIDMQRMMEVCIYKVVEKIIDVLGIDSKLILNKIRNKAKNQIEITKWL